MSEWVNDWQIAWLTAAAAAAAAAEGKKVALHIFRYIYFESISNANVFRAQRSSLRFPFVGAFKGATLSAWMGEWKSEGVTDWMNMCPQVNLALRRRDLSGDWGSGSGIGEWEFRNRGLGPPETNDVTFHWNIIPTMRMLGNYVCFIHYIIIIADDTPAPKK